VYILWSCRTACGQSWKMLALRLPRNLAHFAMKAFKPLSGRPPVVIRRMIMHSVAQGCQTRHLARIFTVDFRETQALNSLRRVSGSTNRVGFGYR
jgi:hypothetical protein